MPTEVSVYSATLPNLDLQAYPNSFQPFLIRFAAFLSYYQESLLSDHGPTLLNLVGAMPCFVVLVLSFIVGRLLDADHSRALMVTGTCLTTVGMFMLSVVNGDGGPGDGDYGLILLCQGVIQGLGMSCFFVTSSQGESALNTTCKTTKLIGTQSSLLGSAREKVSPLGLSLPVRAYVSPKSLSTCTSCDSSSLFFSRSRLPNHAPVSHPIARLQLRSPDGGHSCSHHLRHSHRYGQA